ncbi:polyprotein [Phytophthora megakarya]|uniref:Polyprotein n=1 Tax=Phytophthora megakarya TaxID=4795 RepID=A0A225WB20_9STRA|nr:polyprotein [Phytophthora megakarya]
MSKDMYVTNADGKKIRVAGEGSVHLTDIGGKSIGMGEIGKLTERGMSVDFQRNSCGIGDKSKGVASGGEIGKAYVLDCPQDVVYYTEYSGVDSDWEL